MHWHEVDHSYSKLSKADRKIYLLSVSVKRGRAGGSAVPADVAVPSPEQRSTACVSPGGRVGGCSVLCSGDGGARPPAPAAVTRVRKRCYSHGP